MHSSRTRLSDLLIARSVREIEETGPLDDAQALPEAARITPAREARLIERAWILAGPLGLVDDLQRLRRWTPLLGIGLALLVFVLSSSLLAAALGDGRSVNAITAFFAVLGLNLLSLAAWLAATVLPASSAAAGWLGAGLGRLTLLLGSRVQAIGGRNGPLLLRVGARLLAGRRLTPWAFGLLNHGLWALAYTLLLVAMLWLFSFRAYQMSWETTILPASFFVDFVRVTGHVPGWLGFPSMAGEQALQPAGSTPADARLWAWWLIGCTVSYGLLPRLVLMLLCALVWRQRRASLQLDLTDPVFRRLLNRFDALALPTVVDAERPAPRAAAEWVRPFFDAGASGPPLLVGFELPPELSWPPPALQAQWPQVQRILGTSAERRALLEQLAAAPARRLLLACNGAMSPDRGTERFLRAAARHSAAAALLLVAPGGTRGINAPQWSAWLKASDLQALPLYTDAVEANAWGAQADD